MRKEEVKIYVDKDMRVWLRQQAKDQRCSVAHIVRILILEAMKSK